MRKILKLLCLSLILVPLGLIFAKDVFASPFQLSGKISDSSGNAIVNADIAVVDTSSNTTVVTTVSDGLGDYQVILNQGTYNIQVTAPTGSNLGNALASYYSISSDIIINFILVPPGAVSLSGHVYGPLGNTLQNQTVSVIGSSGQTIASSITNSNGEYSLQVVPGTYSKLDIKNNTANDLALNTPQYNDIWVSNYSITQSVVLDITIPAKRVSVYVKDSSNNSVANVEIDAKNLNQANSGGLSIGGGITNASGTSGYFSPSVKTDANGKGDLWLLPTNQNYSYQFTVIPPVGSGYITTVISGVTVVSDSNLNITILQPVTLSGRVLGPLGNIVPNQIISLIGSDGRAAATSTTDINGNYTLTVAPSIYSKLDIKGQNNNASLNIPHYYEIMVNNYSIYQNTTLDITIPAKKVTVHVQDAFMSPVVGVGISANEAHGNVVNDSALNIGGNINNASGTSQYYSSILGVKTNSSGDITMWLFPTNLNHTYTFIAAPPSGSNYQQSTLSNITFSSDTGLTMTLQLPVTLAGHVYGPLGNPLSNQTVRLANVYGTVATSSTDVNGAYLLQVSAGAYTKLEIVSSTNTDPGINTPQYYDISVDNYSLSQNTTLDITIPAKKVNIHVQNADGMPVSNVEIEAKNLTVANSNGLAIANGINNASGQSGYFHPSVKTDSAGNTSIWLLPNNLNYSYIFTITPPIGGIYMNLTLNNVIITSDQNEVISLSFIHDRPVTAVSLDTKNQDGTYSDPTTVTFSATAVLGYSIANTYYTVDGGSQQTYSIPFTVSGSGSHTITYWSVDNAGVPESPNIKTFIIQTNQAPVVSGITNITVNEGDNYSVNGLFTDPDSTSWTGTVNYGDGSGVQTLAISGTTFTLNHIYKDNGVYTVTVSITDNQGAIGNTTTTVTVNNVAPTVDAITVSPTGPQIINTIISASASFTDPGTLDTHTATWNWGDGNTTNGVISETNGSGSVTGSHTYAFSGIYTLTLTVTDKDGGVGTNMYKYVVIYDPSAGFVTGGGQVSSSLFGISAKYTPNSQTPSGNVGYTFSNGTMIFASTQIDWLVVNGNMVILTGSGTINGSGNYYFLVSAVDGSPDKLRVKISDTLGNLIYDNQLGDSDTSSPTVAISHGQIKIH